MAPFCIAQQGRDHVFGFDLVQRAQLPVAEQLLHGPGQPAQNIDLVDRLVDQRAAAFGCPASLDRAGVIFGATGTTSRSVGLQDLAQPAVGDGFLQELAGIVEAVLADDAQQDAGLARGLDHLARGFEVGRDRLLHLDVLLGFRADLDRLQAEVRERADIDVVDLGVAADFLVGAERTQPPLARRISGRSLR